MKAGRRPPGNPESYPHLRPLEAGIPVVSSHVTQNPRYSIAQNHGQTAPTTVAHHHAHSINRLRFCLHDRTWLLIPCLSLIRSWYYLEYMSVDMFRDAPTHSSSDTRLRPGTIERHTAGEFTTNPIMSSIFLRTLDTCDRPKSFRPRSTLWVPDRCVSIGCKVFSRRQSCTIMACTFDDSSRVCAEMEYECSRDLLITDWAFKPTRFALFELKYR